MNNTMTYKVWDTKTKQMFQVAGIDYVQGEIVDLAQRYGFTFELNPSWYSRDAIDKGLYSLRNFKPSPSIPHLSNDTCLFWVQALLLGLFNPNIPSSAVFKEGVWY